jgi:hypothetical protein
VSNRVSRRQAGRWSAQEPEPEPEPAPASASASADPMADKLTQLKQLGELKSQGVLTEAEFEQQKAKILNS